MSQNLKKMKTKPVRKKTSICNYNKIKQLQKSKARSAKNKTSFQRKINEEVFILSALRKLQTPVFNIHIHLPPYEQHDVKMSLPRIQPVIHLHFDKLEWSSESNKKQNMQTNSEILKQLLRKTLPKFGDIKLYYDDTLKKNVAVSGLDPNKESCSETESCEKNISGSNESLNSSNSSTNFAAKPESNNKDSLSSNLYKDFKLKKAVVVLDDICKTMHYKNLLRVNNSPISENNNYNKSNEKLVEVMSEPEHGVGVLINKESENCPVKLEMDSSESEFLKLFSSENEVDVNSINTLCAKSEMNDSFDADIINQEGTLTALGEGCRFSEILTRFQLKKKDFMEDFENNTSKFHTSGVFSENQGDYYIKSNDEIQENQVTEQLYYNIDWASDNNETEALNDLENDEMSPERANKTKNVEKLKKKPSQVGMSTVSPMKMQSNEKVKKLPQQTQKSSVAEDYIPLQVSGPTKFAVAPLNKVSPYKTHGARNFKAEMLFSNRINRFPSSDYLRTYQLKRKASQNHSKKNSVAEFR